VRLSLDAGRLLVGAWSDGEAGAYAGAAYVFEQDLGGADAWGQRVKLIATGVEPWTWFGLDVSLDAATVSVGGLGDDSACTGNVYCDSGAAWIFTLP